MTATQKLYFSNPGEIDIRAVTTMGVNVKEGESPIGQFGTGVKYAIAGILRLGGTIRIYSGPIEYQFISQSTMIREKEFGIVHMLSAGEDEALGFTTELGRHWEPWMLYRELRSNALDEGGDVITLISGSIEPEEGMTIIEVDCSEVLDAHLQRSYFWLSKENHESLWSGHGLEIFDGPSESLFYHGIRATNKDSSKTLAWNFKYNLTGNHALTEDRTLANFYSAREAIGRALCQCDSKFVLETVLGEEPESLLDYNHYGVQPSKEFIEVVLDRLRRKLKVASSARTMVERHDPEEVAEAELDIPTGIYAMLEQQPPEAEEVKTSQYDWANDMETRMKGLEAQAVYWKACAMKLAGRGVADG